MNFILVVVIAGHILTAGTVDQRTCDGAVASLQGKNIPAVCIAAPVLATGAPDDASVVWML